MMEGAVSYYQAKWEMPYSVLLRHFHYHKLENDLAEQRAEIERQKHG